MNNQNKDKKTALEDIRKIIAEAGMTYEDIEELVEDIRMDWINAEIELYRAEKRKNGITNPGLVFESSNLTQALAQGSVPVKM